MAQNDDNNVMYLLAGFGLGAICGAAAGILFAPKSGREIRENLTDKFKEIKDKSEEWVADQKVKKASAEAMETLGL